MCICSRRFYLSIMLTFRDIEVGFTKMAMANLHIGNKYTLSNSVYRFNNIY